MHFMVKLGFTAAIFFLASCSSDLPDTPKYEFCKVESQNLCKSFYEIPKELCKDLGGDTVDTCEENP